MSGQDHRGRARAGSRAPRRGSERRWGHPRRPYHVAMQREEAGAASITVDAPGFHGSLEELVARANRGDVDLTELSVSAVVEEARSALEAPERQGDLRGVADALTLLARLVALKAAAVLPDQDTTCSSPRTTSPPTPGRRLAEYRLFKAAAEALLAEAATEGARSFLGLVSTRGDPGRAPPDRPGAPRGGLPSSARATQRCRTAPGRRSRSRWRTRCVCFGIAWPQAPSSSRRCSQA